MGDDFDSTCKSTRRQLTSETAVAITQLFNDN